MIPAQMEQATEEGAYQACIASILDISVENVPCFTGIAAEMEWGAWLGAKLNLTALEFQNFAMAPAGYWLLRILSPYPGYRKHTVVMLGMLLAHDPHPEPQDISVAEAGVNGVMLIPLDPSEPSGRFALESAD